MHLFGRDELDQFALQSHIRAAPAVQAGLNPITEGGVITAGNASQICDSSSATLVVSERALKENGLEPVARIANLTVTAGDPVIMLEGPLFATDRALQRAGMSIDDIDLFEVNEASATAYRRCVRAVASPM